MNNKSQINNLEDLRFEKRILQEKIAKKERKIIKRFKEIKLYASPQQIIGEVGEKYGFNGDYISLLLPLALKLRTSFIGANWFQKLRKIPPKKLAIYSVLGLGLGAGLYYYIRKKRATTKTQANSFSFIEDSEDVIF